MQIRLLLVTLALFLAFPVLARADSIVYLKDGQVWISGADGSGARRFTAAQNSWQWPSEADDGTVVVAGGEAHGSYGKPSSDLYRFSGDGTQIGGVIPTSGSYATSSCISQPPTGVRVSFDATKIAYGSYLCGSSEYTTFWTPSSSTGLNFPNQTLGQQDFYEPAWQDNNTFLVTHAGPTVSDSQARWYLHDVSQGDSQGTTGWNEPAMTGTGQQGLISRQGTTLAVFEDDAASQVSGTPTKFHLWLYRAASLPVNAGWGNPKCEIALDPAVTTRPFFVSPSFSPDGTKILWGDDQGVKVMSIANLSTCPTVADAALLIPGGAQPFYSKGDVQPAAVIPVVAPKPVAKFKFKASKHGLKVSFDASGSKRAVSFSWTFGDGKKGSGRKVSHKYKKPGKYSVTLTVRSAAGKTAKVTHKVKAVR